MCDYSLTNVASRPAKVGDKLTTSHFTNTSSRGFADANDSATAVCVLPGTEIAFEQDVLVVENSMWIDGAANASTTIPHRTAIFRQVDKEIACRHHDALEFPDGKIMLLTRLQSGQHAHILQMPVTCEQRIPYNEGGVASTTQAPATEYVG